MDSQRNLKISCLFSFKKIWPGLKTAVSDLNCFAGRFRSLAKQTKSKLIYTGALREKAVLSVYWAQQYIPPPAIHATALAAALPKDQTSVCLYSQLIIRLNYVNKDCWNIILGGCWNNFWHRWLSSAQWNDCGNLSNVMFDFYRRIISELISTIRVIETTHTIM